MASWRIIYLTAFTQFCLNKPLFRILTWRSLTWRPSQIDLDRCRSFSRQKFKFLHLDLFWQESRDQIDLKFALQSKANEQALVVAQLAEWLLPTPEDPSSNPPIHQQFTLKSFPNCWKNGNKVKLTIMTKNFYFASRRRLIKKRMSIPRRNKFDSMTFDQLCSVNDFLLFLQWQHKYWHYYLLFLNSVVVSL